MMINELNCSLVGRCERSEHKNFVVVSHGFPIDPDYNIFTHPQTAAEKDAMANRSVTFPSPLRLFYGDPNVIKHDCTVPLWDNDIYPSGNRSSVKKSRPKTSINASGSYTGLFVQ